MNSLTLIVKSLQKKFAEREKEQTFGELKIVTIWRNGVITEWRFVEEEIHRPAAGSEPGPVPPIPAARRG